MTDGGGIMGGHLGLIQRIIGLRTLVTVQGLIRVEIMALEFKLDNNEEAEIEYQRVMS